MKHVMYRFLGKIDQFWYRVVSLLGPRWIVNNESEMGFRWFWTNFYYYKRSKPIVYDRDTIWRYCSKMEFGEAVLSNYGFDNPVEDTPDLAVEVSVDGSVSVIQFGNEPREISNVR